MRNLTFVLAFLFLPSVSYGQTKDSQTSATTSAEDQNEMPVFDSSIGFSQYGDNNKGRTSVLNLAIGIRPQLQLVASGGRAYTKDQVDDTQNTRFGSLGVQTFGRKFDFGVLLETWGTRDALSTRSIRAPLAYNAKDYSIFLSPRVGRLEINYAGNRSGTMGTSSLALGAALYIPAPWVFRVNIEKFNYEEDIKILANENFQYIFSETTLALSGSLLDFQSVVSVGYEFKNWSLTAEASSSKSGIDEAESRALTMIGSWKPGLRWIFDLSLGGSRLEDPSQTETESTNNLGIGATYLW